MICPSERFIDLCGSLFESRVDVYAAEFGIVVIALEIVFDFREHLLATITIVTQRLFLRGHRGGNERREEHDE